ncbi:hypothetical protein FHY13_003507 [Xanthomonas arboricola]|uniref:hypothetical protein n=1 Tax=Xanthomonas euroxanthea TaxID=2259622 RepID=UPI001620D395|nr:hypothetical protein [Xanthomonas euroxanthea]MBB3815126.1 hypothetical protein [Xanthomonas euroxanthea]
MKRRPAINFLCGLLLFSLFKMASANDWVRDVEVTQLGAYQAASAHFVWFGTLSQECKSSPTMYFDDSKPGGKALMATLLAALLNKRKVDYQAVGCDIIEVYLK